MPSGSESNYTRGMFELLGTGEVRLWVNRGAGYSIFLPGEPVVIAPPDDGPRYDAMVRISDLPIDVGIRIDTVPTQIEAVALMLSLASAYAKNRTDEEVASRRVPLSNLPRGATAGISCTYSLRQRESSDSFGMEYLYVAVRQASDNVEVLYLTARFRHPDLNPFRWRSFRGAIFGQQRWDGSGIEAPVPELFPDSVLAHPGVSLAFTDHAMAEAKAKADVLERQVEENITTFIQTLFALVTEDAPPIMQVPEFVIDGIPSRLCESLPAAVVEVLVRNLDEVMTFHDLRAWAWQCVWAIGNARPAHER